MSLDWRRSYLANNSPCPCICTCSCTCTWSLFGRVGPLVGFAPNNQITNLGRPLAWTWAFSVLFCSIVLFRGHLFRGVIHAENHVCKILQKKQSMHTHCLQPLSVQCLCLCLCLFLCLLFCIRLCLCLCEFFQSILKVQESVVDWLSAGRPLPLSTGKQQSMTSSSAWQSLIFSTPFSMALDRIDGW